MKILLIIALVLASLQADVKHFKSTSQAVDAFIEALEKRDKQALEEMFTSRYKEVIVVKEVNADDLKRFLNAYERSHSFETLDGKRMYIEVGKNGWTFPIPLVKDKKGWSFDINMGIENMMVREIGKNELAIITALRAKISLDKLQAREDLTAFEIFKDNDLIVALPQDYERTAIMSFVVDKNGNLYEADLEDKAYAFDKRFKQINKDDWTY